jgi:hypothetical protein
MMKKIMSVKNLVVSTILLAAILLLSMFCAVGCSPDMGLHGACVSISFDKRDMLAADRLVLKLPSGEYTVTDKNLVQTLAREVLTATSTEDYCCGNLNEGFFSFYQGDKLIRKMRFIQNHRILVYETDGAHWVLFGKEGHCEFSAATEEQLCKAISRRVLN